MGTKRTTLDAFSGTRGELLALLRDRKVSRPSTVAAFCAWSTIAATLVAALATT